ncbi:hypothetical protein HWV62_10359 [Athelia sp. TMB]|nr:hypothetical protein HWV62_10359 [Athelia sp. TMB]
MQCSNCHWTKIHTPAYVFADAEALLIRYQARQDRTYIPQRALNAPLRPSLPPTPHPEKPEKICCDNARCISKKNGTRTMGNILCIEYLCASCCKLARVTAIESNLERPKCPAHNVGAAVATQNERADIPLTAALPPPPSSNAPVLFPSQPNPPPTQTPSSSRLTIPSAPASSSQIGRSLAQPMGANWQRQRQEAASTALAKKSAKIEKDELEAQKKRTCDFRIWWKNGQDALAYQSFVRTYPDLALCSLVPVFKQCGYIDNSFVEYWNGHRWISTLPDISITVNVSHPTLIRLPRSLVEPLTDCPGLEDELKLQPRALSKGKRAAQEPLVSPVKVARMDSSTTASQAIRKSRETIDLSDSPAKSKHTAQEIIELSDSDDSPTISTRKLAYTPQATASNALPAGTALALCPFPLDPPRFESTGRSNSSQGHTVRTWPASYYVCEIVEGLSAIALQMDNGIAQSAAFSSIFPGPKYGTTQMSNTRAILRNCGSTVLDHFVHYGRRPKGRWPSFKAALPSTIGAIKGFSDHQAIQDLEARLASGSDSDTAVKTELSEVIDIDSDSDSEMEDLYAKDSTSSDLLCCFCDRPIGMKLSEELKSQQQQLMQISVPDPLPNNPKHRKTSSFTQTIGFCERHLVESKSFATASDQGWPQAIDFANLWDRVLAFRRSLEALVTPGLTVSSNEFYNQIKSRVAGMSTSSVSSAAGQYTLFEGHSAGYYGYEGYQIISSALEFMFPDASFDTSPFKPLSWSSFREHVLLPEASTHLIQQDLPHLDRKNAIKTMRDSGTFGAILHPGDNSVYVDRALSISNAARRRAERLEVSVE